jgi:protein-S-isoprenylcysteine O-methyltransferase Ste14
MIPFLRTVAWLACVVYSTIPIFWLAIHPYAKYWRTRQGNPYQVLAPLWVAMWIAMGAMTWRWRTVTCYDVPWSWFAAAILSAIGASIYVLAARNFTGSQLGGLPEVVAGHRQQQLITTGIRSRVRHPVYLGHLCEMLAWSIGSGLLVAYALTIFALASGFFMIRTEDRELLERFGDDYRSYRRSVPGILPRL